MAEDGRSILEPVRAPAIYADGIGPVHDLRGIVTFMFTAETCRLDGTGTDRVAVARMTFARDRLRAILTTLAPFAQ